MTILEAIIEELKPYPIRTNLVEKKCLDFDLAKDEDYTKTDRKKTVGAVISILEQYLTLGSITEGGVSLSFSDKEALKLRIRFLRKEIGEDSEGLEPTVKQLFVY